MDLFTDSRKVSEKRSKKGGMVSCKNSSGTFSRAYSRRDVKIQSLTTNYSSTPVKLGVGLTTLISNLTK